MPVKKNKKQLFWPTITNTNMCFPNSMKTLTGPVCFGQIGLRMSFSAANALGRPAEYVGGSVILWDHSMNPFGGH